MVEEAGWRKDKSFHPIIGSPWQQFPSYCAWEPPVLWLLSYCHSEAHIPAFGSSSKSMLVVLGGFIQPGPSRACLWLHDAGGWACHGHSDLWISSKQTEAACQLLRLWGPSWGHMGNCQREEGDQRRNIASSSPSCWEMLMHRKLSRSNDSSNHDNVRSTALAGLPQGLTLFHTMSISPFFWCVLLFQW